jgi:hypothetical protein
MSESSISIILDDKNKNIFAKMKIGNKIIFAKTNTALSDQISISSYLPTLLPECHQLHQEEGRPSRADAHPRR